MRPWTHSAVVTVLGAVDVGTVLALPSSLSSLPTVRAGGPGGLAPDSASDWWNFAANALIAVLTLVALGFSIRTAIRANAEAARERVRAQDAEELARQTQLESAQLQVEAQREIARESLVRRRREDAEDRAAKQASSIRVRYSDPFDLPPDESGNQRRGVNWTVANPSSGRITQVVIDTYERPAGSAWRSDFAGSEPMGELESVEALSERTGILMQEFAPSDVPPTLAVGITFTDVDDNRWMLKPSRSLYLLNPRIVDVHPGK